MKDLVRIAAIASALLLALVPCAGISLAAAQVRAVKAEPPGQRGVPTAGQQGPGPPTQTTGQLDLHGTLQTTTAPTPSTGTPAAENSSQDTQGDEPARAATVEDVEAESLANELRSSRTSDLEALPVMGKSRRADRR